MADGVTQVRRAIRTEASAQTHHPTAPPPYTATIGNVAAIAQASDSALARAGNG